jgi:hypothetical protein
LPLSSPTSDPDGAVYLMLDDFGRFGRAYRETDVSAADRQTVIANLLSGPVRTSAQNRRLQCP